MDSLLELHYSKIDQSCSFINGLKITTKVKLIGRNCTSSQITLLDIFMVGINSNQIFCDFPAMQFSFPKRILHEGFDDFWLIIGESSLEKMKTCTNLYLIIEFNSLDYPSQKYLIFSITSPDWVNSSWNISPSSLSIKNSEDFQSVLINAQNNHRIVKQFDIELSKTLSKRRAIKNEATRRNKAMDINTVNIRIVESSIGHVQSGSECFFILVELENASDEIRKFEISNLSLYDCENVKLTFIDYINNISPSEDGLDSHSKDRFYIGFKTDKTKMKNSPLTLKFNINVFGYSETIEEAILIEKIGCNWKETLHRIKSPALSQYEKSQLQKRLLTQEKLERLLQQLKSGIYSFGNDNGFVFDKITLAYDEKHVSVRGLIRRNRKSNNLDHFSIIAVSSDNRILEKKMVLLYSVKSFSSWYVFDEEFYRTSLDEIHDFIIAG